MTTRDAASRRNRSGELAADLIVHVAGITAGVIGALVLVRFAVGSRDGLVTAAASVYSVGLVLMLSCSAACNIGRASRYGWLLRRLDHAAIFIMIAGTYTPFTVCRLHGSWAIGMTTAQWTGALGGAVMKLTRPGRFERLSLHFYLGLGWLVVIGARPMLAGVPGDALALLAAGGVLYTTGVVFYLWQSLPYQSAIWHGFVVAAATCHYFAVLTGVVLPAAG